MTSKLALQWLPCQAPGVIGSALGLVGPVSVYCDWVRWKVWSAASISVWQHVKLSVQIRPWDTLACCWDVKQPTNKQTIFFVCLLACLFACLYVCFSMTHRNERSPYNKNHTIQTKLVFQSLCICNSIPHHIWIGMPMVDSDLILPQNLTWWTLTLSNRVTPCLRTSRGGPWPYPIGSPPASKPHVVDPDLIQ